MWLHSSSFLHLKTIFQEYYLVSLFLYCFQTFLSAVLWCSVIALKESVVGVVEPSALNAVRALPTWECLWPVSYIIDTTFVLQFIPWRVQRCSHRSKHLTRASRTQEFTIAADFVSLSARGLNRRNCSHRRLRDWVGTRYTRGSSSLHSGNPLLLHLFAEVFIPDFCIMKQDGEG